MIETSKRPSIFVLVVLEIRAALVQASGVLLKFLVTRRLHLAKEVQRTIRDGLAFRYALARIVKFLAAQHKLLRTQKHNKRD